MVNCKPKEIPGIQMPEATSLIARRLKAARQLSGFSLQELVDNLPVKITRQAIHKYEQGSVVPDSSMISQLCAALHIRPDWLYQSESFAIGPVDLKTSKKLPGKSRRRIEHQTGILLSNYFELEDLLNLSGQFNADFRTNPLKSAADLELLASAFRSMLSAANGPLHDLISALEGLHIKIIELELPAAFDVVSAWVKNNRVPVLILNKNVKTDPVFLPYILIQAMGWLILNPSRLPAVLKKKYASTFASSVLLPEKLLLKLTGVGRSHALVPEIVLISRQYGVPIPQLLQRMVALGVITQKYSYLLSKVIPPADFNAKEHKSFSNSHHSFRFRQLLFRALGEGIITVSKAAALCNQTAAEFTKYN